LCENIVAITINNHSYEILNHNYQNYKAAIKEIHIYEITMK